MCCCRQRFTFARGLPFSADRAFLIRCPLRALPTILLCLDLVIRHHDSSILREEPRSSVNTGQSGKRMINAVIGEVKTGWDRTSADADWGRKQRKRAKPSTCASCPRRQSSANERPASCCSFQDCVHTVARNSSIASVSPSKSLRYKYRGFQSIRTPPRSNTAIEHSAMRRKILTGRTTPVEVFSIHRACHSVEVSADGKTLTMTMHIPGRSAPNVRVFDRE